MNEPTPKDTPKLPSVTYFGDPLCDDPFNWIELYETKKFYRRGKHGKRHAFYTARCPDCGKRSRLHWYIGNYKLTCSWCGQENYPPYTSGGRPVLWKAQS